METKDVIQLILGYSLSLITIFFSIWRWDAKRSAERDVALDKKEKFIREDYEKKIERLNGQIFEVQHTLSGRLTEVILGNTDALLNYTKALNDISMSQKLETKTMDTLTQAVTQLEIKIMDKLNELKDQFEAIQKFIQSKQVDSNTIVKENLNEPKL